MMMLKLFGLILNADLTVGKVEQVNLHTDFAERAKEMEQLFHKLKSLGSFDDEHDEHEVEDVKLVQGGRMGN